MCACVWKPVIDIKCLSLLFSTLFFNAEALPNLELSYSVNLASQQTLGILFPPVFSSVSISPDIFIDTHQYWLVGLQGMYLTTQAISTQPPTYSYSFKLQGTQIRVLNLKYSKFSLSINQVCTWPDQASKYFLCEYLFMQK